MFYFQYSRGIVNGTGLLYGYSGFLREAVSDITTFEQKGMNFCQNKRGIPVKSSLYLLATITNLGLSSPSRSLLLAGGHQHGLEMVCCYS